MPGMLAAVAAGGLFGVGVVLVLWKRARNYRLLRCLSLRQMHGKVVVVTGASSGLGREFAFEMTARGAEVVLACRDQRKAEESLKYILAKCAKQSSFDPAKAKLHLVDLDLSSLRSIEECAQVIKSRFPRIDVLVNNAGVMMCPLSYTADGFETHLGVNHIGHFHLTNLLTDALVGHASRARILVVSSGYYIKGHPWWDSWNTPGEPYPHYKPIMGYARSKLACCLHSVALAKKLKGQNVGVYCIKPGFVRGTELGRHRSPILRFLARPIIWLVSKSIQQGIQTFLYCALEDTESVLGNNGELYDNCSMIEYNSELVNEQLADEFWDTTQMWIDEKKKHSEIGKTESVEESPLRMLMKPSEEPSISVTPAADDVSKSPSGGGSAAVSGASTPPLISEDMMRSMTASATARMIDSRSPKKDGVFRGKEGDDFRSEGGSSSMLLDVDESVELLGVEGAGGEDSMSLSVNLGSEAGGDEEDTLMKQSRSKDNTLTTGSTLEDSQVSVGGGTVDNGSDWETIDDAPSSPSRIPADSDANAGKSDK